MTVSTQEVEAKFAVRNLGSFRSRLLAEGAHLEMDRHLERNWRFDLADASLTAAGRVLRLRQAARTTLTLKQAGANPLVRTEIEIEVDQAQSTRAILEGLGYQVTMLYEKYREVFSGEAALFMLDVLPFGAFVEIEAGSIPELEEESQRMGLRWDRRIGASYLELFDRLRAGLPAGPDQATFEAFRQFPQLTTTSLGLVHADEPLRATGR